MRSSPWDRIRHNAIPWMLAVMATLGTAASLNATQGSGVAGTSGEDSRWILRAGALLIKSTGDEAGDVTISPPLPPGANRDKSVGSGAGLGLSAEYLLRKHLGLELVLLLGTLDAGLTLNLPDARPADGEDIDYTAVTAGLNYHFTPARRADFYAGFHAQSTSFDDLTHRFPETGHSAAVTFDEAVGWSVKVGVDVALGAEGPWLFSASAQHLREPLDVKPVVAWVGVGYRR